MKNNWNYILGLDNIADTDNNIAVIIDELFKNFIYSKKEEDHIIAFSISLDCYYAVYLKRVGNNVRIKVLPLKENSNSNLNYDINIKITENVISTIDASISYVKKYNDIKNYSERIYSKLFCKTNTVSNKTNTYIDTSIYFTNKNLINNYVIPDSRCKTLVKKNNSNIIIGNKIYYDTLQTDYNFIEYTASYPALFVLLREHRDFLNNLNLKNNVKSYSKSNSKIGF